MGHAKAANITNRKDKVRVARRDGSAIVLRRVLTILGTEVDVTD